jgi:putative phage-type endonuclease
MNIVRVTQGSLEWHEHRRRYRNASETPVVLGVSPWKTPYQLWQEKLGLVQPAVTAAMVHGGELEPAARAAYEGRTGFVMQPLVLLDGEYSASLDGVTIGGDRIVEIKCPYKGQSSALWQAVEGGGHLPKHYQLQVQHQLMVSGAEIADVFIFDGSDGILVEVLPDPTAWPRIHEGWDTFAEYVATKAAPPLCDRDKRVREDAEWLSAAAHYLDIKLAAEQAQEALTEAKERLVALATHTSETGGRVTVTRFWKAGVIEYKRIPQLQGVDLEQYRGCNRLETRVTADD